jgi:hypothetical protein
MNNSSKDYAKNFYKNKYLLYKQKYIDLKQKLGGAGAKDFLIKGIPDEKLVDSPDTFLEQLPETFLKELEKLYPATKKDPVKLNDLYKDHTITYGEMDYDGMNKLLKHLQNQNIDFNHFIDVGSGRGKLPLQVASLPNVIRSVGIEVVKERHDEAEELKQKLKQFKKIIDKVVLINNDFNKVELSHYINDKTLVWISNLCFPQELTNLIFNKLLEILPSGSIIAASKEHFLNTPKLFNIGSLHIPMSWNKSSNIFIYKIM